MVNIVVPLAGIDPQYREMGAPKPFVDVCGDKLISRISSSRPFSYKNAIFVILQEHERKYGFKKQLQTLFGKTVQIVEIEKMTCGAPQSILCAKQLIDNDEPLIIDLADQYLDLPDFLKFLRRTDADGVVPIFESFYYDQGYVKLTDNGFVSRVSEKDKTPISSKSTACIYYFKRGKDFVRCAEKMIKKQKVATNGAYLVSLVYNEMIDEKKIVVPFKCELVANLGKLKGVQSFELYERPLKASKDIFKTNVLSANIFAHRGESLNFGENTAEAINMALTNEFSVELDVRKTSDNIFVLSHDETYVDEERVKHRISETKFTDIMERGKKMCTFDDALDALRLCANRTYAVHVKQEMNETDLSILCKKIFDRRLLNRTFLFADGKNTVKLPKKLKKISFDVKCALHIRAGEEFDVALAEIVDVLWVDEQKIGDIDESLVKFAKEKDKLTIAISPEIYPGNADEMGERWRELHHMGVDGICTDCPHQIKNLKL